MCHHCHCFSSSLLFHIWSTWFYKSLGVFVFYSRDVSLIVWFVFLTDVLKAICRCIAGCFPPHSWDLDWSWARPHVTYIAFPPRQFKGCLGVGDRNSTWFKKKCKVSTAEALALFPRKLVQLGYQLFDNPAQKDLHRRLGQDLLEEQQFMASRTKSRNV